MGYPETTGPVELKRHVCAKMLDIRLHVPSECHVHLESGNHGDKEMHKQESLIQQGTQRM